MTATNSTPQRPLGSGFGPTITASEVLAGVDLHGQTAVVTGGYSGVGLAVVRALASAGASVVVPARRVERARSEVAGLAGVEVAELDLADLGSVARFAESFLDSGRSIDILVTAAGVMVPPETRVGPGWELQWATNHLGHFALTNRLWPALIAEAGARVVAFSSAGHKISDIQWDDVDLAHYDPWQGYGQSKTANVLFALELDRLGANHGVRAFSVHPGNVRTQGQRHLSPAAWVELGWVGEDGDDLIDWKSPEQGAATAIWAATSPALGDHGGVYLEDCDIAETVDPTDFSHGVAAYAVDANSATRLWALSAASTGVNAFAGS